MVLINLERNRSELHPCEIMHEQATQSECQLSQSQHLPEQGSLRRTVWKQKEARSLLVTP